VCVCCCEVRYHTKTLAFRVRFVEGATSRAVGLRLRTTYALQ
jgi:hypothetical protein